jgi:hypothetical protein
MLPFLYVFTVRRVNALKKKAWMPANLSLLERRGNRAGTQARKQEKSTRGAGAPERAKAEGLS